MYCLECGHPIDEEVEVCPNCGAQLHKMSVETEEEKTASVTLSEDNASPRKNSKLFLMIGAGVVVLAALVMLLVNFGAVKNWFTGLFVSPEDLFVNVYKGTANAVLEPILQEYDKNLKKGGADAIAGDGQILVKPGKQMLDTLAYSIYGGAGDMSWLSEVRFDVAVAINDKLQKNVVVLGLGDQDILSLELIADSENQKQYLTVPELSGQGLVIDMSQMQELQEADMTKLYAAMPSGQVIKQIFDRYADILLGGFSNIEKNTEEVTLGGITQELTVLTAMIDQTDMIEVAIKLLEQAKQDQDIKKILEDMEPWYQDMVAQNAYEPLDKDEHLSLYEEFIEEIDATLADLQEQLKKADPENQMYLYTYLGKDYHIAGIKVQATGMEAPVSFMMLSQDSQFAAEFFLDDTKVTGSGQFGDSMSAGYELFVGADKMLDLKLESVTQTAGVIYLEPSAALMMELFEEMGVDSASAGMLGMADIVLRINYEENEDTSKSAVTLLSNDTSILEVVVSGEMTEPQEIKVPENAVDVNNEDAIYNWAAGLDIEGIFENITQAGVPEELFASLLTIQ